MRVKPRIEIAVHDARPDAPCRIVDRGLGESNAAAAPLRTIRPVSAFACLPSGEVVGGAVGRTWGECCELQQLWVHPAHRRCGIGARLVRAIEARARRRGCRLVHLDTFSFQAPDLYRALGYEVRSEIAGFAPGVVKYTMVRMLDDEPRAAQPSVAAGSRGMPPANVDEYIAGFAPHVQAALRQVRQAVREAAPDAREVVSYRMPALKGRGILVWFGAFRHHIGLYPPVRGDARLQRAVAPYAGEKGNLRFPLDKPMPLELIRRVTRLRVGQDDASRPASGKAAEPTGRSAASARAPRVSSGEPAQRGR